MATYDAGDARLQIFPDASKFKERLEADLKKINVDYKVQVHPNLAQATADLDRWRQQQQRNAVELKVDVDTTAATAKISALSKMLSGGGSGNGGSGGGIMSALKFNAAALGIGSLPAAATAIATVASSIQQLAGAGAVLPGALSGIAVTVGTVKVGLTGVSDAFKAIDKASDGTAKNVDAANKALAKLAPSAAEAVKAGAEIKAQLSQALVAPTQQNLFDGLAASAHKFVNADLPIVQRGMAGLATALNGNAKQLLSSLGSDSSQSFLDRIFGNTTDAQTRLSKAIDPAVHAIGTLAAAGSDALPRLADGVGKLFDRFDKFATNSDANGSLDKWINGGITGLDHLGNAALNIGKVFTSITSAAGGGDGLLGTLDNLTGELSTFLASDQGQTDLRNFFQEGREQLAKWEPIIANVAQALPGIYQGAKQWTDAILPPLEKITGFLADSPDLVRDFALAFVAWKSIDGVASLVSKLGGIGDGLDLLPGKAAKSAGGISGALSKIVLPAALSAVVLDQTSGMIGPDKSSASNVGGLGANVAGGAAAGGLVGGAPGAIVGAIAGLGASIYQRVLADIQAGQKAFEDSWTQNHQDPGRPGNPDTANALTGRDKILQPSLNAPAIPQDLATKLAAGQVPGFTLRPDGTVVGSDGQVVNLPPGLIGPNAAPAAPAPKPVVAIPRLPGSQIPTPAGIPIPAAPPTPINAVPAAPAVQQQTQANPLLAGPAAAAAKVTVDPGAQNQVDKLASSITKLPEGKVQITDATPAVLDNLTKLGAKIETLPEGKVVITPQTEQAAAAIDRFIRDQQSKQIQLRISAAPGGGAPLPVAPGHARGGITGILPGYSPGKDNMLVPMSGGEGVIVPQVARALGPAGVAAINGGALTRGYAGGGIVDKFGNPITPGAAPGPGGFVPGAGPAPIAPGAAGSDGGGVGGIFSSVLSGLGGPISNIANLAGAAGGTGAAGAGAGGFTPNGSFMDRLAGIPGIAGLIGSAGSSNPGAALTNWGGQTGKWLGGFTAKTVGSFGNALWSGALGAVGLENSILSPSNPWFQDAAKGAGFALDDSGPLGALLGVGDSSKGATAKQVRDGGQKISRADQKVAQIIQEINELKPNASQSRRSSLRDQLLNAQQEAADARSDFSTLTGGADPAAAQAAASADDSAAAAGGTSHHGGPGVLVPLSGGEGILSPEIAAKLGPSGVAAINAGKLTKGFKNGGIIPISRGFAPGGIVPIPAGMVSPPPKPNFQTPSARSITAPPTGGRAQVPTTSTKQLPGPVAAPPGPAAPAAPAAPANPGQPGFAAGDGPAPITTAPTGDGLNHNLAAINTGISSAASAIGQAVSTAIGIGAGAAGTFGGGGLGALGSYAAGAIQEGGKVVSDLVNVGSSFLVGSVPGSIQQGPAQGDLMSSAQNVPSTATDNRRNYTFNGVDSDRIVDDIRLKDAQDSQGELARFRG